MPSSITSAPAAGSAVRIASEVSGSGSPAVRKVTNAARPCVRSSAKRWSMRVVMSDAAGLVRSSMRRSRAPALAHGGEADIDRADHQHHNRAHDSRPFVVAENRPWLKQPPAPEIYQLD